MHLDDQPAASVDGRHRAEQEARRQATLLRLLESAALAANEAKTVDEALGTVMEVVGDTLGLPVGQVWWRRPGEAGTLSPRALWRVADAAYLPYRQRVEHLQHPPDASVVWRVLATGQPCWVEDLQTDPGTAEADVAVASGLSAVFALPIVAGTGTIAVLELLGPEPVVPDADLLRIMLHVGTQLGHVIDRMLATAALREAEERFKAIFATAALGIAQLEPDGRLAELNPALVELLGYSREDLLGRSIHELCLPDDELESRRLFDEFAAGDAGGYRTEAQWHRVDGSTLRAEVTMSAMRDEAGRLRLAIAMVEDVTQRKQLELELRHSQKLESVGRLAAGVAHEINTPIQFVGDNVSFLRSAFDDLFGLHDAYRHCLDGLAGQVDDAAVAPVLEAETAADLDFLRPEVTSAIEQTLDGVQRVATIVQAMKSFAHPTSGERQGPADLNRALSDTITVARNELRYVAEVTTDFGELPPVSCFLGDLNQVFLNLLVNAADAIAETGEQGRVSVRTRQEGDEVVVEIADTGTGIPEELQAKVFEQFFTTKEVGKGTGQGLSLARSVVHDKHGGSMGMTSEVGVGTTFTIRLPIDGVPERPG
jgi:two-component system NtrC family sensor kinase